MGNVRLLILVACAALVVQRASAWRPTYIREAVDDDRDWGSIAACLPHTVGLIQRHEGRYSCAYDHKNGFRAVGAGYNLEDEVQTRREELNTLLADFDKVYKGEMCLTQAQIPSLLVYDAKRALERLEENFPDVRHFCCSVKAVFADIQHSAPTRREFPKRDMKKAVENAKQEEYKSAAKELRDTEWCSKNLNRMRCQVNEVILALGCDYSRF